MEFPKQIELISTFQHKAVSPFLDHIIWIYSMYLSIHVFFMFVLLFIYHDK